MKGLSSHRQPQAPALSAAFEKTISFNHAQAIVWQIKFILNNITSKKTMTAATNELANLSEQFGKEFDRYLLKELIEQIDLKDPNKASKDKTEQFKVQMFNQEFARSCQKPDFLQSFGDIASSLYHERIGDFLNELTKRLRLNFPAQVLVALSLFESNRQDTTSEASKVLKQKLVDYHNYGKPEPLPEYAVHHILYLIQTHPDFNSDESLKDISQYVIDSNQLKPNSNIALRPVLQFDLMYGNTNSEEPSISLFKEGTGLDNLDKAYRMLEPWQLLLDLGHFCSYNYNYLLMTLSDFKDINEKTMAKTLLHLAFNHTGTDDQTARIVYNTFEANKKGDAQSLNKDPNDKKTQMQWSIDNLARAFRELYSNLNWLKVFEALSELDDNIELDQKGFSTFLQIFNKSKPQNLQYPLHVMIDMEWSSSLLQINFINNSIQFYLEKKDKSIDFKRISNRQDYVDDLQGVNDNVQVEMFNVWQCIDLVEKLVNLSHSHYFAKVRSIFELPLKIMPEYLLLTLSHTKPSQGNLMIDELLSLLLPQFLGNHINSIPVLQQLWKNNQDLMIRGICELCRHDQRIMNLSRVLDITQEVKESLIPIVDCEDYYFAVNLGILAGKRDFLHYDVWLKSRIKDIGTPFIKALLKYIKENIIVPINDYIKRQSALQHNVGEINSEHLEQFKVQVLDRSHLSKEKLCITLEHLQNPSNTQSSKIKSETIEQIKEVVVKTTEMFPSQMQPPQNSEEIDNAANDYFQKVFSAEPNQVDQKIAELIDTMQTFKESDIKKEQEIYACMLHSLFDEYRFLHRYPQQYLEKIAKLFGAIVKNRIIDGTLLDIALKFAYEAFRREGKRQKFGVITIRQFFDMLPQFPSFFSDIYEIRHNLQNTDPQMLQELEKLWEKSQKTLQGEASAKNAEDSKKDDRDKNDANKRQDRSSEEVKPTQQQLQAKATEKNLEITLMKKLEQMPIENDNTSYHSGQNSYRSQNSSNSQQQQNVQQHYQPTKTAVNQQTNARAQVQQVVQEPIQNLQRTSTPLQNVPVFIPSYKGQNAQQQQQQQTQQQQQVQAEQTSLNVQSAAFKRGPTIVQQQPTPVQQQQIVQPSLNLNVRNFFPTNNIRGSAGNTVVNQQLLQQQIQINERIQKAITENTKLRVEDLIEDASLTGPNQDVQEKIKFICNNTGKNNFNQKLEDLKGLIGTADLANLQWFIHLILTKRIVSQVSNLHHIYIEMIKQIGIKEAFNMTIVAAIECFKKCMIIDEEQFSKVAQRASNYGSPIKPYLINLGQFLGGLTVASNRPILAKDLDFKQLLIEGFQGDKLKYIVTFVCRIFKECQKSQIFKIQNPWINSVLSNLREIYDYCASINRAHSQNEILLEIDALYKALGINNFNEIAPSGFVKALQTQQYISHSQQIEINHYLSKGNLIPQTIPVVSQQIPQQLGPLRQGNSPAPNLLPINSLISQGLPQRINTPGQDMSSQQVHQNYQVNTQIYTRVAISRDIMQILNRTLNQKEDQIRKIIGDAVDSSIVEILPPVVDRSVTIALITTRELVLKDFAYDGDHTKILKAADLIVQNLAGSLALVTCREPLKMSLTTNLRKTLTQINAQMGGQEILSDNQIQDIATMASKENLELGCKLIKKAVIDKALKKVREDLQIVKAIEKRKENESLGKKNFVDENIINQFQDLPPQLQPSPNGLNDAQFQVYEDFAKLNIYSKKNFSQEQPAQQDQTAPINKKYVQEKFEELSSNKQNQNQTIPVQENLDAILASVEGKNGLSQVNKDNLEQKINELNKEPKADDIQKLWIHIDKWLHAACQKFNTDNSTNIDSLIQVTSLIVNKFKVEDFSKKLTHSFLQFNESIINNVDLNILLMKNGIISISEWDVQLAVFLKESAAQLSDNVLQFVADFLEAAIHTHKVLTYNQVPHLIQAIEMVSKNPNVGKFFQSVIEHLKKKQPLLGGGNTATDVTPLKEYFTEWVIMSYGESSPNQEQDINRYFNNLTKMDFFKDSTMMSSFCKVMVETSIEKALYNNEGARRPNDRLDYRYIESFIKLIVVLLKTSDFNKHEFMSKVFESIQESLDEEHRTKKTEFNQKPYYRMLMNILTAVNHSQCFNQKTHLLILFSLADLFNKLNPNKYPAFAFAWLELISHKQFMPHFLKGSQTAIQGAPQTSSSQNTPGGGSSSVAQGSSATAAAQDNTFYQKWFKFKELIVNLFTFLKSNMIIGQKTPQPMIKFYEATLRICLVILHDFPEFLCDFHFNFVNSLPEQCIQIRNLILSAFPLNIQPPNPFARNLKVDLLQEVKCQPKILSNFDNYLSLMNLREDLENYFRTKKQGVINVICDKMMSSEEIINGKRKINANVINAVVLFIANQAFTKSGYEVSHKESMELFKQMVQKLNNETRWSFLNSIINELRYPNNHTYYFSCIILYLFVESNKEQIQEQIAKILFERLQVHRPHPWGLMISFRELIQNPKYGFMKKNFIVQNQGAIDILFQTRLKDFLPSITNYKQQPTQQQQQQYENNQTSQQQQDQ